MSNILNLMDNSYLYTLLKLFVILYSAIIAPNLPSHIATMFHNSIFQIILFAIITFVATKDITMSILLTIAFFISFHSLWLCVALFIEIFINLFFFTINFSYCLWTL